MCNSFSTYISPKVKRSELTGKVRWHEGYWQHLLRWNYSEESFVKDLIMGVKYGFCLYLEPISRKKAPAQAKVAKKKVQKKTKYTNTRPMKTVRRKYCEVACQSGRNVKCTTTYPSAVEHKSGATAFERCQTVLKACMSSPRTPMVKTTETPRQQRDRIQREAAKARVKAAYKAIPKQERVKSVKLNRDKRNPAIELQSGAVLRAVACTAIGALSVKVLSLLGAGKKTFELVNEVLQNLKKVKKNLISHLGKSLWIAPMTAVIYYIFTKIKAVHSNVASLALSVFSIAIIKFFPKDLWYHIRNFFPGADVGTVELQSGFRDCAPKLLATAFTFSVFGKKMSPHNVTEFCKRIAVLPRMADGWEVFCDWMIAAVETCVNLVRSWVGKERIDLTRKANKAVHDWARRVEAMELEQVTASKDTDAEVLDTMVKLCVEGSGFRDVYRGTTMARYVESYFVKASNLLQPHLGAINARNNFRFEPIAAMLLGKPGVGKTVLAMPLCSAVLIESGLLPKGCTSDDVAKNVWQKGTSEFWNGYSSPLCVVMDDAFQQRPDSSDKDNEYMSIIRMIGSWSFPLNFADLNSKGKIYFSSKFVFGTTNLASFRSDANIVINEPAAVARRITFPYELVLKPEFATPEGRLDQDKFQAEVRKCTVNKALDRFPWYMWDVYEHDFMRGVRIGERKDLRELIVEMANSLKQRSKNFQNSANMLKDFVQGFADDVEVQSGRNLNKDWWYYLPHEGKIRTCKVNFKTEAVQAEFDATVLQSWSDVLGTSLGEGYLWLFRRETFGESDAQEVLRAIESLQEMKGTTGNVYCSQLIAIKRDTFWHKAEKRLREFEEHLKKFMQAETELETFARGFVLTIAAYVSIAVVLHLAKCILTGIWNFVKTLFGIKGKKGVPRVVPESNRPLSVKQPFKNNVSQKVEVNDIRLQSSGGSVATNIYANTYKMFLETNAGSNYVIGQVTFLVGELAVQPQHFTDSVKDLLRDGTVTNDSNVFFRNAVNPAHVLTFTVRKYLEFERVTQASNDVEFLKFESVRAHRDIVGNFMREADLRFLSGKRCRMDVCEIDDRKKIVSANARYVHTMPAATYRDGLVFGNRRLDRYFNYNAQTTAGDCGAPVCIFDNTPFSGRTAFGFHVSSQVAASIGYCNIVTQEMIEAARRTFGVFKDDFAADFESRGLTLQAGHELPFSESGSFMPIGTVAKPINLCPKTSYYVVPRLFGALGDYEYLPAPMSPVWRDGEWICPMNNAVAPYATPVLHFDQPWLQQAMHVAMKQLTAVTEGHKPGLYTFEEAILGIPQEKFRSIPRGTSPGFPYVYDTRDGKKEFFGDGEQYDLTSNKAIELRHRVEHIIAQAEKGTRCAHVFVDFLKDELRSKAKVEKVATRLISSAPLDYTVAWRMYFGAFSTAVMNNYIDTGMAPGICVYTDWNHLASRLTKKGDKVFDGDFGAFDSSEQPCIHDLILDYINKWYNDGEKAARVRKVLWLDLVHSRHIGGNGTDQRYIYQWNKSLPSGHPFTTIVNSIYSLFCLVAAYIHLTGDKVGFWNHVSPITYGDDNVSNISDAIADKFNQVTVAGALEELFSMRYTPGRKDGVWQPYTDLSSVTFLKRSFYNAKARDGWRWLCPLELDSFLYTFYWCKNKKLEKDIIRDVMENALQELSMHTSDKWDAFAPTIYDLLKREGKTPDAPLEQRCYLDIILSRSDNWY